MDSSKNISTSVISITLFLTVVISGFIGSCLYTFHNIMLSKELSSDGTYITGKMLQQGVFLENILPPKYILYFKNFPSLKYARYYGYKEFQSIDLQYPFKILGRTLKYYDIDGDNKTDYKEITGNITINGEKIKIKKKIILSDKNAEEFSEIDALFQGFEIERKKAIQLQKTL